MNIRNLFNILFSVVGVSWLFYMFSFPSEYTVIKYILLILLVLFSLAEIIFLRKNQNKTLFLGILGWLFLCLSYLFLGLFNSYPVDFNLISIYFITPILSYILSQIIDSENRLKYLSKILIWITFFIVCLDLLYVLDVQNILKLGFNFKSDIYGSVSVSEEKLEFRITNQTSLMFLLPFLIAHLANNEYEKNKKEKYFYFLILLLGAIVTIVSGRRAFQIVVFASVVISYLLIFFKNKKIKIKFTPIFLLKNMLVVFTILISTIFLLNILSSLFEIDNFAESIFNTLSSAFDSSTSSGEIRKVQLSALIEGWKSSPIFGHGLSSYLRDYTRSYETPWSYEWVYVALLYQTGIVGIIFFSYSIFKILGLLYYYSNDLRQKYEKHFFSILVGFCCFLIAGASNPMVYYIWMWAIALIPFHFEKNKLTK